MFNFLFGVKPVMKIVGKSVVGKLSRPSSKSHKGQNGLLLVVGGSGKYHGAPLLAVKAASRIVDLVYFHSPEKLNHKILALMKSKSDCFIALERKDLLSTAEKADCILIGNGLEADSDNKTLVNSLLRKFPGKKFVLDAGALHLVDKKLLGKNVLVTPHVLEFKALFGVAATPEEAKRQARKHNCVVLLKKTFCFISDGKSLVRNSNGNAGMTKGGTGDVLAGLCSAFACTNGLFLSAQAAAFVNGFSGDRLKRRKNVYYNADDLAGEIPFALKELGG